MMLDFFLFNVDKNGRTIEQIHHPRVNVTTNTYQSPSHSTNPKTDY